MKAIISISKGKMERIKENNLHTLELITPDNVETAEELEKGELIFITEEGKKDINVGTVGLIGEVRSKKTFYQKINTLYDEEETLTIRIQVDYMDEAKAVEVMVKDRGVEVDIERHFLMG